MKFTELLTGTRAAPTNRHPVREEGEPHGETMSEWSGVSNGDGDN